MSAGCCHRDDRGHGQPHRARPAYRRVLWIALVLNALMFVVEIAAGLGARSTSLQADALDFLGDAANYAIALLVLGMVPVWRTRAALLKAASMAAFGLWVIGMALWAAVTQPVPEAHVMGAVGALALAVNLGVAVMLFRFREGDANMRSVWLCTRNDALGNLAVLGAAAGVLGTGTVWPDLAVAAVMATLALSSAFHVLRRARLELKTVQVV